MVFSTIPSIPCYFQQSYSAQPNSAGAECEGEKEEEGACDGLNGPVLQGSKALKGQWHLKHGVLNMILLLEYVDLFGFHVGLLDFGGLVVVATRT